MTPATVHRRREVEIMPDAPASARPSPRPELAEAIDRFRDAFDRVEARFRASSFTAPGFTKLPDGWELGWKKISGVWSLILVDQNGEYSPLNNSPLERRCDAAHALERLVVELHRAADRQLAELSAATALLDVFDPASVPSGAKSTATS